MTHDESHAATTEPGAATVSEPRVGAGLLRRAGRLARRHWSLLILLTAGLILRVITQLAYQPAMLYIDSFRYLSHLSLDPGGLDPIGYSVILIPLLQVGRVFGIGLALVAAIQHLLGLAMAVALYALVLRLGGRRWLGALITLPVLLDAYQLQIEQNIMSEPWFQAILVAAMWLLVGRRRTTASGPGLPQVLVADGLIAATVPVRTIGIVVMLPFLAYLVVVGARWRDRAWWRSMTVRVGAGLLSFVVVLAPYVVYFRYATGYWGLNGSRSSVLYGRAATVANCDELDLNTYLTKLCPDEPRDQRLGVDAYAHGGIRLENLPPGTSNSALRTQFAHTVILHQPLDMTWAALRDFSKGFAWTRTTSHNDVPLHRWQFQTHYPRWEYTDANTYTRFYDGMDPTIVQPLTRFLRGYQLNGGYTPGTLLAVAGLVGFAGAIFRPRSRLRARSLLLAATPTVLLLGSAAFEFSWRYQLPGLVLFPLAGAIGFVALTRRNRVPLAGYPDPVDAAAVARFDRDYPGARFADIVVVIAAYQEEAGIGPVVEQMPTQCVGPDGETRRVDTLVVVDGSTDRTAETAAERGAYVCAAPANRGQGGALRLGYRLAARGGAGYLVTTDADGQYDIAELPDLISPILSDEADFVTGSRRLGHEEADSTLRWVGVRVFATLASLLTRRHITDTSFGFRAMRSELAGDVTLTEPQYQASELLIGVLARGARVVEVPLTMRLRSSGSTKKGGSLSYGANYARVMVGTWCREYVGNRANRARRRHHRWRNTNRSNRVNLTKKTAP